MRNMSKNDWETDTKTSPSQQNSGGVPTFIRVIVIRRIVLNSIKHSINNDDKNDEYVKGLISEMKDLEDSMVSKVHKTLTQLIAVNGIKNYFNSWDEKDNNPLIIEMIFQKLILTKFVNEYENIITYNSKNMENNNRLYYYQDLIFNTKDLMCSIFEFVDYMYDKDLVNCSLVCSNWLYYVYETSLLDIDDHLEKLIIYTIRYDVKNNADNDSSGVRMWQRLTKLKSIYCMLGDDIPAPNQLLLDKLSILKNVQKMSGICGAKHFAMVKSIINNCKDNMKNYSFKIRSNNQKKVLSPVVFANATHISIRCLYFYVIWLDKCQELGLNWVQNIDKEWCNFVIKNCDCSNIKTLQFSWKNFVKKDFIDTQGEELIKKFAKQFINLEKLIIDNYRKCDEIVLLFCEYLKDIIDKNNVEIQLGYEKFNQTSQFNKLIKWIKQLNIANKINKLYFSLSDDIEHGPFDHESIKPLLMLAASNIEWIQFTSINWDSRNDMNVDSIVNCMNQIAFKSLKVFEYTDEDCFRSTMQSVKNILQMVIDKLKKNKFYFMAHFEIECEEKMDSLFNTFCEKIFDLMIKDEIAIDISLQIYQATDTSKHDEYYNVYVSYFNQQRIFKDYKLPQCNKYCIPLSIPKMSFSWNDEEKCSEFVVKSAAEQFY